MIGVGEDVSEGFGAAVTGSFDRDLVARSQGEVTAVLATDALDVLDEPVEIELFGLALEPIQIEHRTVAAVIGVDDAFRHGRLGRVFWGSSIRLHGGKTKGNRCDA